MAHAFPPQHLLDQVAERFRVLADSTRLTILGHLIDDGEMNVGQLVDALGTSQANISKHLRVLLDAGVVARRQQGTAAYYRLDDPVVIALCDLVCNRLREQAVEEARAFALPAFGAAPA